MLPVKGPARQLKVLYQGHDFLLNVADGEMVNLNELWVALGNPEGKDPKRWTQLDSTKDLVEALTVALSQKDGKTVLLKAKPGKGGGTLAHWQVALAYAKYLSPQFHQVVNQVFKERLEEERDPELGVTRATQRAIRSYERRGRDPQWIQERLEGIGQRNSFTYTLQRHQVEGYGYATCTNEIYRGTFGANAEELKDHLGLPKKANVRDYMTAVGLAATRLAELIAEEKIEQEGRSGNEACAKTCGMAGRSVKQALESAQVTGIKEKVKCPGNR